MRRRFASDAMVITREKKGRISIINYSFFDPVDPALEPSVA